MVDDLKDRRALVVGGSGGVGAAVSAALADRAAAIVIHGGHIGEKLERAAASARARGARVETVLREITSPSDAGTLVEAAGETDILVVSFGPYMSAPIHRTSDAQWEEMVGLNLTLPAILVSRLLPGMISRGYGRILLFGGPRSDRSGGYRDIAAYAAAKHGLASLTRSVALQYGSSGVRCNMICPGYVDTEYQDEARKARIADRLPSGRLVSVEELAGLALHLISAASDAVNGAIIPVDFGV